MKRTLPILLVLAAVASIACVTAAYAETSQGQVVVVQEKTLFIRAQNGEPLSFNPKFVNNGHEWVVPRPINTILPALESGEVVSVSWFWDNNEGRRRIEDISILSPREGTSRGMVVSANANTLVLAPQDKPGTVTLNTKPVQVGGRWVPDPKVSTTLTTLKPRTHVTVGWAWDNEGRKRITNLEVQQ